MSSNSSLRILQAYDSDSDQEEERTLSSPKNGVVVGDCRSPPKMETACSCLPADRPQIKRPRLGVPAVSNNASSNVPEGKVESKSTSLRNGNGEVGGDGASKMTLPLPKNILEMFSKDGKEDEYNDPKLHMGRKRTFAHVRGNWASFLYLPCTCSDEGDVMSNLQSVMDKASTRFEGAHGIHSIDEKHVTLSRTLAFRHHWIEDFVSNLRKEVGGFRRIQLVLEGFTAYTNDEKTRTFISMKVSTTESLLALVKICDECLAEYEMPPYYEDPSFHISCAWMLGDATKWAESELLPYLNKKWSQLVDQDADMQVYSADFVELKTGNQFYRFPFKK